ncbi:MAG: alpha/beta fold hydrolase [Xanthomonadales bacterium]|nr:alpha/beta fold hydrolase [Xanthomonadales bacterium]
MPAAEEITLADSGLAARCWGDPAGPPLLALHGWLDNAGSFDALAPLLARQWYVVALDLRGHGRSAHLPPGAWYHYVDAFDDLAAAFACFGWKRAALLGHSLGATLASLYAGLYPERVSRLLLVEGLGPLSGVPEDALQRLRGGLDQRAAFASRRPLRVFDSPEQAVQARMKAGGLSAAAASAIVSRGIEAVEGGWTWSSDPRLTLASPIRFTEPEVLAMLAGIRAPTRLVLAEPATPYLPAEVMERRAAQVRGIRVARLAGHHHLHLEQAGDVAAALGGA